MPTLKCSFCGKTQREVHKLIAGPTTLICNECVTLASEVVRDSPRLGLRITTPHEIRETVERGVVYSSRSMQRLSVAIYQHYQYWSERTRPNYFPFAKSCLLLVGPTGSGKERLARTLAERLDVPFAAADATKLHEYGYGGEDGVAVVAELLEAALGNMSQATRGIVYLDKLDHLSPRPEFDGAFNPHIRRGMQEVLVQMFEGTDMIITTGRSTSYRHSLGGMWLPVDTTNVLFICGGAFDGIEDIVAARNVGNPDAEPLEEIEPADLMEYGLSPFLTRCLPVIAMVGPRGGDGGRG